MSDNLPTILNPLKDKDNPRSLVNITPSSLSKAINFIPDSVFELSEKEVRKVANVGEIEDRLRISFWREYDIAQQTGKKMNIQNIVKGNCSDSHFFRKILTNNFKLAYILTPPTDYLTQIEDIYQLGMQRMRQILEYDPVDVDTGKMDFKIAEVQRRITEDAHLRFKGAIPYKMMTENLHVHKNLNTSDPNKLLDKKYESVDEIKARIRELESGESTQEIEVKEVVDVTPEKNTQGES